MKRGDFLSLLRLSRSDWDEGECETTEALAAVETLVTIPRHRVAPLLAPLCRGLRRRGMWSQLSPRARKMLDRWRLEAVARVAHRRRWLAETFAELKRRGISCVLLKSDAFNGMLYSNDAPRLGGDVDLLVAGEHFAETGAVFEKRSRRAGPCRDRRASYLVGYEHQFITDGPFSFLVEVHRALTIPWIFSIDHSALIDRSRPHSAFENPAVRVLSPVDTLLHLAVHSFRHLRVEAHSLLDTHEAWIKWRPSALELVERAAGWGAQGALYMLLVAARELAGTRIPPQLLDSLRPSAPRERLARLIYGHATERDLRLLDRSYRLVQLASLAVVPDRRLGVARYLSTYAAQRVGDLLLKENPR